MKPNVSNCLFHVNIVSLFLSTQCVYFQLPVNFAFVTEIWNSAITGQILLPNRVFPPRALHNWSLPFHPTRPPHAINLSYNSIVHCSCDDGTGDCWVTPNKVALVSEHSQNFYSSKRFPSRYFYLAKHPLFPVYFTDMQNRKTCLQIICMLFWVTFKTRIMLGCLEILQNFSKYLHRILEKYWILNIFNLLRILPVPDLEDPFEGSAYVVSLSPNLVQVTNLCS